MKAAVEHVFTGVTGSLASGSYDSTKTLLGTLFKQFSGSLSTDNYVSVNPTVVFNIFDAAATNYHCPHVYQWSSDVFWIFAPAGPSAAVTRTIGLFEYRPSSNTVTWKGFITLSGTTFAGVKTIRGLRAMVSNHTTGTVSTSGASTTITGDSTVFQTDRIAVGARIGFGSTDPTTITTWYDITAIASDTSLTIQAPVTLSAGTSYVIEEIRIAATTTNATLYNGGVHLIKGLNYSTFSPAGTTIVEATSTDNVRASYLLREKDAGTFTITIAAPGVITKASHGFVAGDLVQFSTTGALPTGLAVNTTYYVTATSLAANTFTVSATLGGAAITTTGSQSGVHTVYAGCMTISMGLALTGTPTSTSQLCDVLNLDNTTNVRVINLNLRAALTTTAGAATGAFNFKTGNATITGTAGQLNNARVFSVGHGPASGSSSLYFCTTTRVYRCAESSIVDASTSWLSDFMIENPPGSSTTYPNTAAMSQVDYTSTLDRVLITTNAAARFGTYVSQYNPSNPQAERIFGQTTNRAKTTTTSADASNGFYPAAVPTIWTEAGYMFAMVSSVTANINLLTILPAGAEAAYAATTNQRVHTPKLATTNASRLYRAYLQTNQYNNDFALGNATDSCRLYYRTSGIDDNSGAWTETVSGDLSGVAPGSYIQFMIELEVLGEFCIPKRVYSVVCVYEDGSQDSHYEPSLTNSSAQNRIFAWRQITSWGSNIPNLRIQLWNVANGFSVLDDDITSSSSGVWQYSSDGGSSWQSWSAAADTVGNYIRYTATTLPSNITVRALLTQG